jgi:hypothetical protein
VIHLNYERDGRGGHKAYDFLASVERHQCEGQGLASRRAAAISSMCPSLPAASSMAFPDDSS